MGDAIESANGLSSSGEAAGAAARLIDLLRMPACLVGPDGGVRRLNAAWQRLAGAAGPSVGTPWAQLIDARDRGAALARLDSAGAGTPPAAFECRLATEQGPARWHALQLQDAPGAAGWLCLATDIHALKLGMLQLQAQARTQAQMLDAGPDCIKLVSPGGRLLYANRAGCTALGIAADAAFGMRWLDLLPAEVRPLGEQALAAAGAGQTARFPGRSVLPGLPAQHWDNLLTPLHGPDGIGPAILCISREVTAAHEAQESLRRSQQRLAMAASVGGLGVWDYDIRQDVLLCDDAWHGIMGLDPATPVRSLAAFRPIIHPEDVERATEVDETATQAIASQGHYKIEFRIVRPDGEIRWVRSVASILLDEDGTPARAIGFVIDITDARQGEMRLRETNRALASDKLALLRQSQEDPLTGLANRRVLDQELVRICAQAREAGEAVTVAMLDVDHFKAYNDRYGHLRGDDALRGVARALQSVARRTDLVTRYGGEEFVAVFPGIAQPGPLLERLAQAIEALALPHAASPHGRLTASCGCAVFAPGAELLPAVLLQACDVALYEAKAAGRNRSVVHLRSGPPHAAAP